MGEGEHLRGWSRRARNADAQVQVSASYDWPSMLTITVRARGLTPDEAQEMANSIELAVIAYRTRAKRGKDDSRD